MREGKGRRKFLSTLGLGAAGTTILSNPIHASANSNFSDYQDIPQDLKITDIKTYKLGRAIFVKVETNEGTSGWGEASPNGKEVVDAFIHNNLKQIAIGKNPFDQELIWDRMFWENHDFGPGGALPYAIAGIDLAIWDLKGKLLNQPVYNLIGGQYRNEMPAYGGIPVKGGNIPVEEAVDRAQKLVDLGFKIIKLRMQIREYNLDPNPDPTLNYYEALRKALPDSIEIFVDPNEGYTAARAITIGKALQEMGMKYYESPCPLENHRDTAEVVKAMDIPVMAGEKSYTRWQIRDLILEANPDIIQPDPIKAGGITELKKIAALAQTFFKAMAPHNTKPTLGTAASLHVLASVSNAGPFLEYVELDTYQDVLSVFDTLVEFKDGKLKVPQRPGLGLVINEDKLKKLTQ